MPTGCLLLDVVKDHMRHNPPTNVFLVSHGYNADHKSAEKDFQDWAEHMTKPEALPGLFAMHAKRGRDFMPLVICVHWPFQYMAKLRAHLSDGSLSSAGVELVKNVPGVAGRLAMATGRGARESFRNVKTQEGNGLRKASIAVVVCAKGTARCSMDGFFGRYEHSQQHLIESEPEPIYGCHV